MRNSASVVPIEFDSVRTPAKREDSTSSRMWSTSLPSTNSSTSTALTRGERGRPNASPATAMLDDAT